jgi:hypothetical protein
MFVECHRCVLFARDDTQSITLDAIDFSSWLARLTRAKKTHIRMKMSVFGVEVPVLEKMHLDDTLYLIHTFDIEWSDRDNRQLRARRIYLQLEFNGNGYDCIYYTRLEDTRQVYHAHGNAHEVKKHYDWRPLNRSDLFAHYVQRPDGLVLLVKRNKKVK